MRFCKLSPYLAANLVSSASVWHVVLGCGLHATTLLWTTQCQPNLQALSDMSGTLVHHMRMS